jgi:metal-responsive CopG/Arc/MetJ family transcriptional regulator
MRTLVDIPDVELLKLNDLSKKRKVSRAHLVRCAITEYVQKESRDSLAAVFGIWADKTGDSMAYLDELRKEWDREF